MYRVMMVDDEIWSLIGFQRIIEEDNERFTLIGEMTDPVEALEKICKEEPDIVFVDIRMPEMSGIELMQEAKKRGVKSAFVVISGFAEFSYVQEALKAGAIDYQLKPFDKSAAKETLDNLYERLGGEKASEDLKLYAKLRDDEFSAGEVLRERFPGPLFPKLQIMQILYKGSYEPLKRDRDPYFSGDSWRTKLKIGPDRGLYIVNSVEEQTPYMLRWYRDNKDRVRKVSMSSPVSPDVSGRYILREADTNLLDAFVYPEETCFTFRRPNIEAVESLTRTIKQLKGQGKEDEIYQMVADLQSYFEKYQLGVREALCLWNILVTYSMEWNDNPAAWLEYLDVFSLTSRFGDLQEMGAYLNGKRIHTSKKPLEESLVLFGTSPYQKEYTDPSFVLMRKYFDRCVDLRRSGSAAFDLCCVAAGRVGLYFEMSLGLWDYAAGAIIVSEAGGRVTDMEGNPLSFRGSSSAVAIGEGLIGTPCLPGEL